MLRISYILLHLRISEKIIAKIKVFSLQSNPQIHHISPTDPEPEAVHPSPEKFFRFLPLPAIHLRPISQEPERSLFQDGAASMVHTPHAGSGFQGRPSTSFHSGLPPDLHVPYRKFPSAVIPMCEDGIARTWFIWTIWSWGSLNRLHMPVLCSAFCQHQIIISVSFYKYAVPPEISRRSQG